MAKKTQKTGQQLLDMQHALGYTCLRKDRRDGNGGGVAIVYKTGDLELKEIPTGSDYEIIAALGRRTGQRRKMIVISAYLPPLLTSEESDKVMQNIMSLIGRCKRKYNSPYFLIGGDFNRRNIEHELATYPDIELVHTPPTRGVNTLDLVFSNFHQCIVKAGVTEPICNTGGVESDHKTVYMCATMPRVPEYKVEMYTYLKQTEEGDNKLSSFLNEYDWSSIISMKTDPDSMVAEMQRVFEQGMESSYERKTSTKKTSEPSWMTGGIRRLIRRRRAVFRKWGRNEV